jgi:predicted peptidase
LSRHVFVKLAQVEDKEEFAQWSAGTKDNLCDADPLTYAGTIVLKAFDKDGAIVYVPVQRPAMMEALAINPERSAVDVAVALKELTQALVTKCYMENCGEIYMFCKEESTQKFAEHQLFERLEWACYRVRLKDLEKRP